MTMQDKRRFKNQWLLNEIENQGELGFKKDILLAKFCMFFGCSSQLAPRFLKELELLELIIIENKVCFLKKQ